MVPCQDISMSEEVARAHFLAVEVNRMLGPLLSSLIIHPSRCMNSSVLKSWK